MARAKSSGSSAMRMSSRSISAIPSTASEVATTGTPSAMLWLILPFIPAPYRNGATDNLTLSDVILLLRVVIDKRRAHQSSTIFPAGKMAHHEFLRESMHLIAALPRLVQWHEKSSCESNGHRKICGNY